MKKYFISLLSLTLLLALIAFGIMWKAPQVFIVALPILALYFAIVTGVEHYFIVKSAEKDPRTFVRNFFGITVGALFLHLVVLMVYMFSNPSHAKIFAIGFCIGYFAHLIFETTALVLYVKHLRKE